MCIKFEKKNVIWHYLWVIPLIYLVVTCLLSILLKTSIEHQSFFRNKIFQLLSSDQLQHFRFLLTPNNHSSSKKHYRWRSGRISGRTILMHVRGAMRKWVNKFEDLLQVIRAI